MSDITVRGQTLVVRTPYSPEFVRDLKDQIPSPDRKWDRDARVWLVAHKHLQAVQDIIVSCFGMAASMTHDTAVKQTTGSVESRTVKIEYVARVKEDGFAKAWADGAWSVAFPEDVLRDWFDGGFHEKTRQKHEPAPAATLYSLLGAKQTDNADDLKRAYRRAAMTHHPDRSREPDATETFKRIQAAWELLREPIKRAKYDAGLLLEAQLKAQMLNGDTSWMQRPVSSSAYGYVPPVRCGILSVTGIQSINYFQVSAISKWDDEVRTLGNMQFIKVSFWPKGADKFVSKWEAI